MLGLKSKFFKVVFSLFSFVFLSSQSIFAMESAPPVDKKYYAKVVFLGYIGAGKTVLYELLTDQLEKIENKEHSTNIDTTEVEYDVDGKKVRVFFCDTSAEPRHKDVMDKFCHNADIVFAVINAKDLINESSNPTYRPLGQRYFEKLLGRLYKIAPKCRVIVVLTQRHCINKDEYDDADFLKKEIKGYLKTLDKTLKNSENSSSDSDDEGNEVYYNIDAKYDLTLKDVNSDKTLQHKIKLENLITESLRKYGVENLPDNPEGFAAKILEHANYKQNTYFWGLIKGKKEYDYSTYSLNYDNSRTYNSSTDVDEICAIF